MRIAIQGGIGSFHHEAADRFAPGAAEPMVCRTFRAVCEAVHTGAAARGLMAVENSLAGGIVANFALLGEYPLHVHEELYLRVEQHLLALPGQRLADIRTVHSHPVALLQCSRFLAAHPHLECVERWDTAASAADIRRGSLCGTAAIAGPLAAELHGLAALATGIQDHADNYTRFLVLAAAPPAGDPPPDKASVQFRLPHRPGTLAAALAALRRAGVNLTFIQSLPIAENPYEYVFHVDIEWERPGALDPAMAALSGRAAAVRLVGAYHRGCRPAAARAVTS
ncbi:MAG TPA: prephenate dehydratase domain-containing protein [Acidobacteriota bacterium]|nr:prephenate dehydratase domain-containing protein [Acidobacteriota bacterium]HQF85971.1 prephenate dehydratase domain-containing protein [Acidobacteriota bacterium]HQG90786.1 prephenate dehydratase domain-containing protein [Acidobacteriota bacterium]HQK86699.1 prephenate dehydratase domain-containing protein [Acidobacteriota bacterium]